MGSKVGIYPGGPRSGRLGLAHAGAVAQLRTMGHREDALAARLIGRVDQARRSRQLLWVILAVALAALTGLRLASTGMPTPAGIGPAPPALNAPLPRGR